MKLLIISNETISTYYFNPQDAQNILKRCHDAGKQWSNALVGFFINMQNNTHFAAINVKDQNGVIESMEYVDIERNKPEFPISNDFLTLLSTKPPQTEISLAEFEPILSEILSAPIKARKWEVYPEINQHHQLT